MKNSIEVEIPEGLNNDPEEICIGGCDIKKNMFDIQRETGEEIEKRDLEQLREYEKANPTKIKLTKEDKQLIKKQKKIGKDMDSAYKREQFLRNNKDTIPITDYTKILYRLPLTEKQMKDMYVKILDDAKNNNLN
jgi:hypothetical protein